MRRQTLITLLLMILSATEAFTQQVLVLYRPGTEKRFFYKLNDPVSMEVGRSEFSVSGKISAINDSSVTVDKSFVIPFRRISYVSRPRFAAGLLKPVFISAGAGYLGLTIANRALQKQQPLLDKGSAITSGSLLALAGLCHVSRFRHFDTRGTWRFKVLDYDQFNKEQQEKE